MSDHTFHLLLDDCQRGSRTSQRELYRQFYAYGMNVCLHYSKNREEAQEVLNDGFLKIFLKLGQYDRKSSFKSWLRQILVRSAIDYFRKYHRKEQTLDILPDEQKPVQNEGLAQLSLDEVLAVIQRLPPAYRIVFNLFEIEGYTHPEIAMMLEISVGASKSNLSKAKEKLRKWLQNDFAAQKQIK